MTPLVTISPVYTLGLSRDFCPQCGARLPASVVVNGATVVDVFNAWLEDGEENYEEIPIVCVETKRTAPPKQSLTKAEAEQPA